MMGLALLLALVQVPADTVHLDAEAALERGLAHSSTLSAARHLSEAAAGRADQARAWPNPHVGVSAENVGQQRMFTDLSGVEGLEGQAVVTAPLPLGFERAGQIRSARAFSELAAAEASAAELEARTRILSAIGTLLREESRTRAAREELATLEGIADALSRQADAGRTSLGDAARADLARTLAATALARREASLAGASAELARLLGLAPATPVRIDPGRCSAPGVEAVAAADPNAPVLAAARARVDAARGAVQIAQGIRLPDIAPQIGVRRTGGLTGLYLGLATTLPLFDRGSRRIAAARSEESAALELQAAAESRLAADHAAASTSLAALERAGRAFDREWFDNVERTVTASEARFQLGEGTLFELLDSRRARIQALDDYALWLTEWWTARAELARLEGRPVTASLICVDPYRENR